MSEPVKQRLFSLQETAALLGRSVNAVRALIYAGHFETFQLCRRGKIFIPREAIDDFIRSNTLTRTPRASGAGIVGGRGAKAVAR